MGYTVETSEATRGMVLDVLGDAGGAWLTVLAVAERMPVYRSQQCVQQHMKVMYENGELDRRVRDVIAAPFDDPRAGGGDDAQ